MADEQTALPRWRGFNLLEMFTTKSSGDFQEDDFRWMAEWGFDFARIPACYTLWTKGDDVYDLDEAMLEKIDRVIELGMTYDIHVSFNFHRGPGYSVNRERQEPFNLWKDPEALDAFIFHWVTLTRRYQGIPSEKLSFDLINEPPRPSADGMTRTDHERVVRAAVKAIRAEDPERLIIADGLGYGRMAMPELVDLGIAQSCRAYEPMGVSHYKAGWVNGMDWPEPHWPGGWHYGDHWTREDLEALYAPWVDLAAQGIGVHCGEGGAYNHTPHDVVLAWFRDVLEILTEHNIGYALWNFRGAFGILDSGRDDVKYEDWHGHKLDREFLELLQAF
jgi:endoglucanase